MFPTIDHPFILLFNVSKEWFLDYEQYQNECRFGDKHRNIYLEGGKLVEDSQSSKKNMASEKLEKIQKRNLM